MAIPRTIPVSVSHMLSFLLIDMQKLTEDHVIHIHKYIFIDGIFNRILSLYLVFI